MRLSSSQSNLQQKKMIPRSFGSKDDEGSETDSKMAAKMAGGELNNHTPLANIYPFPVGYCLGAATAMTFQLRGAPFLNSAMHCCLLRVQKISLCTVGSADFKLQVSILKFTSLFVQS